MAFWGNYFSFDGISCEDFELMLYDIGGETANSGKIIDSVSIIEDNIANKYKPYFYGIKNDGKLQFDLVFGVNNERIDKEQYLDRREIADIALWLTNHNSYKWLTVDQEDLHDIRYKCIISSLELVEYGKVPWALKATVMCDSNYAYMYPKTFKYKVTDSQTINFFDAGNHNGFYRPKFNIRLTDKRNRNIVLINHTDGKRTFELKSIPESVSDIFVDNEHGIIEADNGLNLYPYFNFKFFRSVRGNNKLSGVGNYTIEFICEFPVSVGG